MRVFNFKEFYAAIQKGFIKNVKTTICKMLFNPLFEPAELLDDNGTPYEITNNYASKWTTGTPIPETIRNAVIDELYKEDILVFYRRNILEQISNDLKQDMLDSLIELVNDSNLQKTRKQQLVDLYENGKIGDFLACCFMSAIIGSDKPAKKQEAELPLDDRADEALENFRKIISGKYRKPESIPVPEEVKPEELKYVTALYEAYGETSGLQISGPHDLGKFKKHFDRQRKNYYRAETIHRELRDTIHKDERGFEELKDEVEEGIAEKAEGYYRDPITKVNAVMEQAGLLPLSHNTEDILLGWVGPAEKKGVCHMLVNDERLSWVDENDDD